MLEMLEKLINEHGSSTILKERLLLFSDKYSMLEDKNYHLKERNEELESKLQKAKEEIKRLQKIVDAYSKNQSSEQLDKIPGQILEFLFDVNTNISKEQVSRETGIEASMVSYHFDILKGLEFLSQSTVGRKSSGFVSGRDSSYTPPTFSITLKGRKYVIETIRI